MADTLRVRSTAMMPFKISEPHPDPEKPGNSPLLKTAVLRPGLNTLSGDEVVAYRAWAGTKPEMLQGGTVTEVEGDEPDMSFGFEPALQAASTAGAADGSTIKTAGPVSSADMKPTSDAPPADSPRAEPRNPADPVVPVASPATPPAAAAGKAAMPAPAK